MVMLLAIWQPAVVAQPATDAGDVSKVHQWPRLLGERFNGDVVQSGEFDFVQPPAFQWSLDVGDGYGIGSIVGGHYYHFDTAPDGKNERIRCIDIDSGKVRWQQVQPVNYRDMYGYETGPRSTPTIAGAHLYTMGVDGRLTCRLLADGDLVWTIGTNEKYGVVQNFFGVGGSPLVTDDKVIVMVGGSPDEDQRIAPGRLNRVSPNGSALVAFDRISGNEIWKSGDDLASYSSPRIMQLGTETIVLAFLREHLTAFDPNTGSERWRFRHRAEILESVNAIVPVVDNDLVFISECYQVGSVLLKASATSYEVVWQDPPSDRRRQAMRCHWSTPSLINGFLYGCSGRNAPDSDLRCVELQTGNVKWMDPRRIRSSTTRVDNHLLVLEERGVLQILNVNPEKMDLVAEWDLAVPKPPRPDIQYPCWAAPIVVGDLLLVRGNRKVLCFKLATKPQ